MSDLLVGLDYKMLGAMGVLVCGWVKFLQLVGASGKGIGYVIVIRVSLFCRFCVKICI